MSAPHALPDGSRRFAAMKDRKWRELLRMAKRRKLAPERIARLKADWYASDPHWRRHLSSAEGGS